MTRKFLDYMIWQNKQNEIVKQLDELDAELNTYSQAKKQ